MEDASKWHEEPTQKELDEISELFQASSADPSGCMLSPTPYSAVPNTRLPTFEEIGNYFKAVANTQTHTTLSIDMPFKDLESLAQRLKVPWNILQEACIVDSNNNKLRLVQSIDLATGCAVLNIATNVVVACATLKECTCAKPITACANLSGCYLTFPQPLGAEPDYEPRRIPIEELQ